MHRRTMLVGLIASSGSVLRPRTALAANTSWNPADLLNVTLTGSNLIATTSGAGGVRSVASVNSGKFYWEHTYTTINTNTIANGIALSTASLSSPAAGTSILLRLTGGISINNIATGSSLGVISQGAVIGVAVDFTAKLIWYRIAPAGNWNGSGTADPATGAGGLNIASIATGPLYALFTGGTSDKMTANFGDSVFTGAVPGGFTSGFSSFVSSLSAKGTGNLSLGISLGLNR